MTDLDYLDDLDAEEASSIRPAVGNWVNVTIAFVLALVVAVMNTGPNTTSDSGAYLSVEALVLRGHRLYSGVFDNKDPLFYYVNAGFLWVVGPRGPAIAEALVLALAGAGAAWFALRRGVGWALAVVISATIPIALTCGPAIPGLTHSWGMAFLLLAILALLEHRVGLAGSLVAVAALLELRTAVIGVGAVIAYLVVTRSGRRAWARPAAGAAIVAGVALVALAVRGEFVGYLQVQLYNLRHVEMVRELHHTAGSFPTVLRSGFRTVQGVAPAELLLVVTVAATAIVAIAGRRRVVLALRQRDDGGPGTVAGAVPAEVDAWVVLMVAAVTVVVTALTTLFPHHAQLLGLPIALGAVVAVVSFGRFEAAWAPPLVLGAMLLVAVGLGGPWRSQDRLDGWRATLASPSAVALETAVPAGHEVYAIAGEVAYENAHAVFLDDRFRFSCRYIYQHPWDERDFDEFVRCLATQPDVVLRTPYNPGLEAAFPTYRTLHEQVDRVLDECFELEATFDDDVRAVYVRRPGCRADPPPRSAFDGVGS